MLVVITGFMGSGKSTVAAALGRVIKSRSIDLDHVIRLQNGQTPQQIIDEQGEERFRSIETDALKSVLSEVADAVIALGGGTWIDAANRDEINNRKARIVWLDTPFELCWKRISGSGASRPFAREKATARELFDKRQSIYARADIHVRIGENRSVADTVAEIVRLLDES